MSNCRFDDLWATAAQDGASCPIGLSGNRPGRNLSSEVDELMDAWFHERTARIECSLILDQAGKLLSKLLAEETVTPKKRREMCRILRALRKQLRDEPGETGS